MAMAPLDEIPALDSVADISEVTGPDELDDFSRVVASVFGISRGVKNDSTGPR